jgi:anti-sigma regulatory factor (Ser/Thr protein kinase)
MTHPVVVSPSSNRSGGGGYRHEVFLYRDRDEYVAFLSAFVRDGLGAGERVLVAVPGDRLALLRAAMPDAEGSVAYADMLDVGDNPARILELWRDFLEAAAGAPCRGVGEPVHSGRDVDQLDECQRHERILNVAFDVHPFLLVCPYDASTLGGDILEHARASHPRVHEAGTSEPSPTFRADGHLDDLFAGPLELPPDPVSEFRFGRSGLAGLRRFVEERALAVGLGARTADLVLAANEIATNIVTHGGADGTARCWADSDWFLCELEGPGTITDPLAGRVRPEPARQGGRGLWLANQLCDLVQIRNTDAGSVVRLRLRTPSSGA